MPERTGENIMGIQPIPKLILGTGLPLMVSLLINSLYNFVDSVFVSRVSEAALFLAACALLLVRPYFVWQSAGDAVITDYGTSDLQICMLFSLGLPLGAVMWKRVSGRTLDDFPEEL